MRVRWTTDAADDLERICDYIDQTSSDSARRVAATIVHGIAALRTFPNRGRLGRVEGTRELVERLAQDTLSFVRRYWQRKCR